LSNADKGAVGLIPALELASLIENLENAKELVEEFKREYGERVQKGIAHWDKQNNDMPAPNCVLKVRGEIIKDEGL